MLTIAVLGTLDTKGLEHAFVADCIRQAGHQPLLIDVGSYDPPTIVPDCSRAEVIQDGPMQAEQPSGTNTDRGQAIAAMVQAAPKFLARLANQGRIHGIISLGGSGGTAIGTAAMRALPMGFPKVMVSTVAGGDVSRYVDIADIVMFPSIVDVAGLNRVSRGVFARAAAAVCGMAVANIDLKEESHSQPLIVASMFGNTTGCVEQARNLLEQAGYEVLVFHATGVGGRTMESLIDAGLVSGVLDVTTTEWADELVGGILGAGPHRLEAAARRGIPAVVAPGCLDMVNFGERNSVPHKFSGRRFYQHNPQITLMRTTPEECNRLGEILASKVNLSVGPITVLIPKRAISIVSAIGQPFHDPQADESLFTAIKRNLRKDIVCEELDCEINDAMFAERCVERLLTNIG